MQITHSGEPIGQRSFQAARKIEDLGAAVFHAFVQEGLEPYVKTILIEKKSLSGEIIDVEVKITVCVDRYGLKAEDIVPVRLQLNVNSANSTVQPTHRLVEPVKAQLACIAADARRLSTSLQMFEAKAEAA